MKRRRVAVRSVGSMLTCVALATTHEAHADEVAPGVASECVQASEQGQTDRDRGKYKAARADFLQCARDVCPAIVVRACAKWLREVDDAVPSIVVGARDELGNDIVDASVTLDGAPFTSRLDGQPIEVDTGEHVLRFERGGSLPVEQRLVVRAGEKARSVTVTLRHPPREEPPMEAPASPPREPLTSPRHVTSAALLVAGLGTAGAGVYLSLRATRDGQTAAGLRGDLPSSACSSGQATPTCRTLADTVQAQHAESNAAAALYVGAGALAIGAVAAWFLWPEPGLTRPVTAWASPAPGGATFRVAGILP
jgi:hypothetical protein